MKRERDFFTSTLTLLNPKISFFIGKEGIVCAERDVKQKGSREQTWHSMMMRGRWIKKGNFSVT